VRSSLRVDEIVVREDQGVVAVHPLEEPVVVAEQAQILGLAHVLKHGDGRTRKVCPTLR
jgi:hypothetical protein